MKKKLIAGMIIALVMLLCACGANNDESGQTVDNGVEEIKTEAAESDSIDQSEQHEEGVISMKMRINDIEVNVSWENNSSVKALAKMAENGPVTIGMTPYGGFEQVGSIGETLPSNDTNIKTKAGDIMLYTGDQMVIFYGSNSWAYTRLGHVTDKTAQEMTEILGNGNVTITISAE